MTGRDIIKQMCLLGGKTNEEFDDAYQSEFVCSAINRAVSEVNKIYPLVESVTILHFPIRPVFCKRGITVHRGGEEIAYTASDIKSLAFAISGTGTYTLAGEGTAKLVEESWHDETGFKTVRIVMDEALPEYEGGKVTLTFTGEFTYMIKDVSMYDTLDGPISGDVEAYGEWVPYDLKSPKYLSGRFLGFSKRPVRYNDVDLSAPEDLRVSGSIIYLRGDAEGEYSVECYKTPEVIDLDNLDLEIDVDFRLVDAIALRAAQYVYAVGDEEVSEYCRKEFERVLSLTMVTMPTVSTPTKFRDVRGW